MDVAILQWSAEAIHSNPADVLQIDQVSLQFVCALSMNPLIGKPLMDDIQTVVEQTRPWAIESNFSLSFRGAQLSHLLTTIKLLDADSSIRLELETIAAKMYAKGENACAESRLILGPSHPFVLTMEKSVSKEKLGLCEAQMQSQFMCGRKLHSLGGPDSIISFELDQYFITRHSPTHLLRAIIKEGEFEWKEKVPTAASDMYFDNKPSKDPKDFHLFIVSRLRPPPAFCEEVTSCTSLKDFLKLLKDSTIRQMILTYGITILESSSIFNVV